MKYEELVNFVGFLHKFSNVMRTVKVSGREGFENDAEHSYQVAMASWFIAERMGLKVNQQRLLEYALVHDLVEVYAGDTDMFISSKEHIASKAEREAAALDRIKREFSDFPSLAERLHDYESLLDLESKIVCMVDKFLPDLSLYIGNDDYYKRNKVTLQEWEKWFNSKLKKIGFEDSKMLELANSFKQFVVSRNPFYREG